MIPIIKPFLDEREADAASRVIKSGWITQGPEVAVFEKDFAQYTGAEHACAVSNCTTALHLALLAAGIGQGDEVVTVSHSFIATANAVRYCGALPVFVDIEPQSLNLDPALLERAITPKTKAVLCVHQVGMPCDLARIIPVARKHNLAVIEDAACAIGSEILWDGKWEKVGRPHGDAACFSFHPRKIVTTGDGGMITTSRQDWDKKFRLLRQHGMSVPDTVRHGAREIIFESYVELGYNYRMTDIQAAVGREQLKKLPQVLARRRELAAQYIGMLAGMKGVRAPSEPQWARSNWQSFCVRLDDGVDQKRVMQLMLDNGVSTRRGIMCSHLEPAFKAQPWRAAGSLAQSEAAQEKCILLPLFHQMTEGDMRSVVSQLEKAVAEAVKA